MFLQISKLNLVEPIFPIGHRSNNIEEHVTILNGSVLPNKGHGTLFLAAHSGNDPIAYFNYLNKLESGDILKIHTHDYTFTYIIKDIWEEERNGYIHVNKHTKKQLILTTCSTINNNKQLVVRGIEKSDHF